MSSIFVTRNKDKKQGAQQAKPRNYRETRTNEKTRQCRNTTPLKHFPHRDPPQPQPQSIKSSQTNPTQPCTFVRTTLHTRRTEPPISKSPPNETTQNQTSPSASRYNHNCPAASLFLTFRSNISMIRWGRDNGW